MKKIFPPEIIDHSYESHWVKHDKPFQWVYVLMLVLLITGISLLPFIKVEITTQGRGIIRTAFENSNLQSAIAGQVSESFVQEGLRVSRGDTLVRLETARIDEQIGLKRQQLEENRLFIFDINALLSGKINLRTSRYQFENLQYQAKAHEIGVNLKMARKDFHLAKKLFEEKVTAEMEFMQKKSKYDAIVSQMNYFKQQSENTWQIEKSRLEKENIALQSNIRQLHKEALQYVITAPLSGTLVEVAGIHKGSFISPGQALAKISPDDTFLVECYLSPADIGYVHPKQKVRFQFDSFNYNQWGMLEGEVQSLSDDVIALNDQPVFKVRCLLPQNYLQLKTGHKGFLLKGMSLTARFVLTKRTLYQLLFDKMDDWLNPKRVNN